MFRLEGGRYAEVSRSDWLPEIGLGLTIWEGTFDDKFDKWLRFVRQDGSLLQTGDEMTQLARHEVEIAKQEVEIAKREAELVLKQKAELERKLRELGLEP